MSSRASSAVRRKAWPRSAEVPVSGTMCPTLYPAGLAGFAAGAGACVGVAAGAAQAPTSMPTTTRRTSTREGHERQFALNIGILLKFWLIVLLLDRHRPHADGALDPRLQLAG